MTWQTPSFSIVDAKSHQESVYDLLISSWGVDAVGGDLQFPPLGQAGISTSLAGIAIGPRSTVDRAWVTWNSQKLLDPAVTPNLIRRVSNESPIMFEMAAKPGTIGTSNDPVQAMSQGNLYIFPKTTSTSFTFPDQQDTTICPGSFTKAFPVSGLPVVEPFGANAAAGVFMPPFLHLVLYLRAPFMSPPTKRLPLVTRGAMSAIPPASGGDPETCVAQVPIFGRKYVTVQMSADQEADFRVGSLRALATFGSIGAPQECPEGSAAAVAKYNVSKFQLAHPDADYLTLYCHPTTAAAQCKFVIEATD